MLTGGARTALHRHQTLRASVDWSHALLTEPERSLFRRLGVFLGGFDLEAAQAVGAGTAVEHHQVMDHLTQLVDKSLVVAEDASGAMRYRLLETMRQYALEKLGESDEADAVRDRHRDHYIDRAADLVSLMRGGHQRLMDWADVETRQSAGRVSRGVAKTATWRRRCGSRPRCNRFGSLVAASGKEWRGLTTPCTDAPGPDVAPEVWVRAVAHQSTLAAWLEAPTGLDRARAALSIARQLDDPALIATTLNVCSRTDLGTTRKHPESIWTRPPSWPRRPTIARPCARPSCANNRSGGMAGDPMGARAAAEECRDLADALGDRFTSWSSRIWLGNALLFAGQS